VLIEKGMGSYIVEFNKNLLFLKVPAGKKRGMSVKIV